MEKKNRVMEMLKSLVSNIWYMVMLVAICTAVVVIILNWGKTMTALGRLIKILAPFIIGFFLAYLIKPLVALFKNLFNLVKRGSYMKVKKAAAVILSYIIIVGMIAIIIIYIAPQIRDSLKGIGHSVIRGYNYVSTHKEEMNAMIPFINLGDFMEYIKNNLGSRLLDQGEIVVPYVYEMSSSIAAVFYNILMGLVISIYMILDGRNLINHLKRGVFAIVPKEKSESVWATMRECNHIFNGFLFGKAIDSLIIGIICLIAMSILKLPFALFMSLIVCITNMIPYFGPIIGAIPGVIIYLFISPKLSLIFAIMILILQQFDGLYLGPKILGDLTGIKPLWVIFGITVGGAYFGFVGMFLGVPTVAVIMYLLNLFVEKKLHKKGIELFNSK
ncbi:MAG: AI-2E family transporter [Eubacterium sp.]|nr:AI-2E family transporter [Eubacterium sp.]